MSTGDDADLRQRVRELEEWARGRIARCHAVLDEQGFSFASDAEARTLKHVLRLLGLPTEGE